MYARIKNTYVKELLNNDPRGLYHPDFVFVEVPFNYTKWIDTTFRYINGAFTPQSLQSVRIKMLKDIKARRYNEEIKGALIQISGQPDFRIDTTDRSKVLLTGARQKALIEIDQAIQAAIADGRTEEEGRAEGLAMLHSFDVSDNPEAYPATFPNAVIIVAAEAISAHVQQCFDRWAEINLALRPPTTFEDLVQVYDAEVNQGWPS